MLFNQTESVIITAFSLLHEKYCIPISNATFVGECYVSVLFIFTFELVPPSFFFCFFFLFFSPPIHPSTHSMEKKRQRKRERERKRESIQHSPTVYLFKSTFLQFIHFIPSTCTPSHIHRHSSYHIISYTYTHIISRDFFSLSIPLPIESNLAVSLVKKKQGTHLGVIPSHSCSSIHHPIARHPQREREKWNHHDTSFLLVSCLHWPSVLFFSLVHIWYGGYVDHSLVVNSSPNNESWVSMCVCGELVVVEKGFHSRIHNWEMKTWNERLSEHATWLGHSQTCGHYVDPGSS